jgi:hypothetical protein
VAAHVLVNAVAFSILSWNAFLLVTKPCMAHYLGIFTYLFGHSVDDGTPSPHEMRSLSNDALSQGAAASVVGASPGSVLLSWSPSDEDAAEAAAAEAASCLQSAASHCLAAAQGAGVPQGGAGAAASLCASAARACGAAAAAAAKAFADITADHSAATPAACAGQGGGEQCAAQESSSGVRSVGEGGEDEGGLLQAVFPRECYAVSGYLLGFAAVVCVLWLLVCIASWFPSTKKFRKICRDSFEKVNDMSTRFHPNIF